MRKQLCQFMPGIRWFIGLPLLIFIDQGTKIWVLHHLSLQSSLPLFEGLQLILSFNPGVAFSLFKQEIALMPMLFISFIALICLVIAYWLLKTPLTQKWYGTGLLFILGGALGNLCDRILYGHVIDFIDFYIKSWHWYTFNIADAFITMGALMVFKTIFMPSQKGEL